MENGNYIFTFFFFGQKAMDWLFTAPPVVLMPYITVDILLKGHWKWLFFFDLKLEDEYGTEFLFPEN